MVCIDDVLKGVNRLKTGKADVKEGLSSHHIIHGPKILYVMLALPLIQNVNGNHSATLKPFVQLR